MSTSDKDNQKDIVEPDNIDSTAGNSPCRDDENNQIPANQSSEESNTPCESKAGRKRILFIDDEREALDSYRRMLVNRCDVDCADSAESGLTMLNESEYDFVFIDYMMPIHDGAWFMEKVNAPKTTKILLLTAHTNRPIVNGMFKHGISGYLTKPVDKEEILHHIEYHSEKRA